MKFLEVDMYEVCVCAPCEWDPETHPDIYGVMARVDEVAHKYVSWVRPRGSADGGDLAAIRCTNGRLLRINMRAMKRIWRGVRLDSMDMGAGHAATASRSPIPISLILDKHKTRRRFQNKKARGAVENAPARAPAPETGLADALRAVSACALVDNEHEGDFRHAYYLHPAADGAGHDDDAADIPGAAHGRRDHGPPPGVDGVATGGRATGSPT
jgi:hypothetical protein